MVQKGPMFGQEHCRAGCIPLEKVWEVVIGNGKITSPLNLIDIYSSYSKIKCLHFIADSGNHQECKIVHCFSN